MEPLISAMDDKATVLTLIRAAAAVTLEDETQVSVARRMAGGMAARIGLSADAVARAELVCVELATNVLRHATRGQLYLAATVAGDALQVIATDKGPGIGNLDRALEDGYSTSTTPGLGLGAIKRMVRTLDVYSQRDAGTVLSATVAEAAGPGPVVVSRDLDAAVLSIPIAGETVNGDSWTVWRGETRELYLLVDGLGHGTYAFEASSMTTQLVEQALAGEPAITLTELLTRIHGPLHATRGAAIAAVSVERGVATCCGVGNISTLLVGTDGEVKTVLSHNGTIGHQMRRVQEFAFPFAKGSLLVMHSDGIATHWKLATYPGLLQHAPATICGVLYRDAVRGRDDATVLVARARG